MLTQLKDIIIIIQIIKGKKQNDLETHILHYTLTLLHFIPQAVLKCVEFTIANKP